MTLTPEQRTVLARSLKAESVGTPKARKQKPMEPLAREKLIPDPFAVKPKRKPRSNNGAKQGRPIPTTPGNYKPRNIPNAKPINNTSGKYT